MSIARRILAVVGVGLLPAWLSAQAPPPPSPSPSAPPNPFLLSPEERARLDQLSREDHADMMRQLGITKLRPGANGRAAAGEPGAPNYDPAQANPYPDWPDVLTLKDGRKVTTAELWWQQRRPEIALDFEREVYGRVPEDVPKVTWTVAETVETTVGGQPVVARRVIGHVDNSAHPAVGRGHQDGGRRARQREGAGSRPDDVRLGQHARRAAAAVPGRPGARRPALHRAAHRGRLGLRVARAPPASRPTTAPASPRASSGSPTRASAGRPSSGDRCARGPGARPARSTTWRRCPRSTPGAWASKGCRATARPPS